MTGALSVGMGRAGSPFILHEVLTDASRDRNHYASLFLFLDSSKKQQILGFLISFFLHKEMKKPHSHP